MRFHNPITVLARRAAWRRWLALGAALLWLTPVFAQTLNGTMGNSSNSNSNSSNSNSYNSGTSSSNSSSSSSKNNSTSKSKSSRYSKDTEKNKNRNKAKTKTTPGGVRGSEQTTAVARKGAKTAKAKTSANATPLAPIKVPEAYKENALYFQPAFAQLQPGDRFMTPIFFYNTDKKDAVRLDLWLKYDPAVLSPEWIDTKPLKDRLGATPLDVRFWREDGYLRIHGTLAKPINDSINALPVVHWRAVGAIGSTAVTFQGPGETNWPTIYTTTDNLLKPTNLGHRSLAEFQIGIAPPKSREPGLRMIGDVRAALPAPSENPAERMRLVVDPGPDPLAVGDTGLADVMLLNPQRLSIDLLRFRILYDPTAVQILDADEDNYITDGINIFDGDFHKTMPFDEHIANRVDPTRGIIDYSVALASEPQAFNSGPVARIVFRVLRAQGRPAFQFQMIDPIAKTRCTDVGMLGRSLLGEDPQLARQALNGAYLPLAPGRS
jgi:hypothetical protein